MGIKALALTLLADVAIENPVLLVMMQLSLIK
jgi:hypothetical protein